MMRSAVLGRPLQCARHTAPGPKPCAAGPKGRVARLVVEDKLILKPTGDGDTSHLDNIKAMLPAPVELDQEVYRVGREDADIVLPFPTVSGSHAQLTVGADSVEVVDLDSTNGTYIDGEECPADKPQKLPIGGEVIFGDVHLASFELTQG